MQGNTTYNSSYEQSGKQPIKNASARMTRAGASVMRNPVIQEEYREFEEPVQQPVHDILADCSRWDSENGRWVQARPMKLTQLVQLTTPRDTCHPQSPGIGHPRWNTSTRIDDTLYKTVPKYEKAFQEKFKARKLSTSTPVANKNRVQPLTPDSSMVQDETTKHWSEQSSVQNNAVPVAAKPPMDNSDKPKPPVQRKHSYESSVGAKPTDKPAAQAPKPTDKPEAQTKKPAEPKKPELTGTRVDVEKPKGKEPVDPNKPVHGEEDSQNQTQYPMNVTVTISFEVPMDAPPGYKQTVTRRV